ncbi:MAG: hypothetical protein U5K37_05250 [Natrialbaceae archaeon]|nr:hypothetical protein [Natrialbaceae archaeon]
MLRQLALSGDLSTEEAAVNALRDIAEFPSSSAARIAADTLDTLEEVRQNQGDQAAGTIGSHHRTGSARKQISTAIAVVD